MGLFEEVIGTLLVGVIFNTFLYGVVTHQFLIYWNLKFDDPLRIRLTVIGVFVVDTFHTMGMCCLLWLYCVESYNSPFSLLQTFWPLPLIAITTSLIAFICQTFLAYRIYRFTNSIALYTVILSLAITSLGLGLTCGGKSYQMTRATDSFKLRPIVCAWLGVLVSVDALITISLIRVFSQSRTGFYKSDTILNRLIRGALQTGFLSGIGTILAFSFFMTKPTTNFYIMIAIPVGRVYSITLLDSLIGRQQLRQLWKGTSNSKRESMLWSRDTQGSRRRSDVIQLQVQKEVHIEQTATSTDTTA